MNKDELLQILSEKIATGEISREEIMGQLPSQGSTLTEKGRTFNFSLTKIFYVLGALVALLGIIFFIVRIWDDLGSGGRILITLGLGLILAGTGSFFLKTRPASWLGQIFHTLAGFLIPGGALVTLNELGNSSSLWPVTITIGVIFFFYLLLNSYHRNEVLTFFTVANGTAFIYLLVKSMIDDVLFSSGLTYWHGDIYAYLTMIIGLSYFLVAHSFRGGWNRHLVGVFNFFGAIGFFGAAFSRVFGSEPWRLLFFLLTIGGLSLAIYIKSRAVLIVSVFFLIAHFIYITKEYFADSIGWPILLVILGFLFIGLGYLSITINKKFISVK